jgi:hypothetical protein
MEFGRSQLFKAVCGKSTAPGKQDIRHPRTAISSGLIGERCIRNEGCGTSHVPLKCENIYLPHQADRNFINNLQKNP